jgi:HEPN domain-containing protein
MRTPDQGRWDFVQQWLDRAHRDLRVAAILLRDDVQDYENAGFHAQQAAEKFLKAFLVRYQIEFPKTHNIAQLRQLIEQREPALAERLAPADTLTPYGVEFRYPGALPPLLLDQGVQALQLAEQTRDLILAYLQPYLSAGRPAGEGPANGKGQHP